MGAAESPDGIVPAAQRGEHVVVTRFGLAWPGRGSGGWLLAGATGLLAGLAGAQGYVSWHAQVVFIEAQKHHQHAASVLEAFGLDAGAVIFALLGIALARLGRGAAIERAGVVVCSAGSAAMNLLGADLGSPRSVAVYVMPALLFAATADRLVAVVRRAALGPAADSAGQRSAWHAAGVAALYGLRLVVAPPSTLAGGRRALMQATPLPPGLDARTTRELTAPAPQPDLPAPLGLGFRSDRADGEPVTMSCTCGCRDVEACAFGVVAHIAPDGQPCAGEAPRRLRTKTGAFLARVTERHGPLSGIDPDKVGRVCAELHGDLDEGSARTALRRAVLAAREDGAGL